MKKYPLEGYRITDLGWTAAAPRATCILADMGAEVIKIETRTRFDPIRFGPDNVTRDPEKDPLFHSINRNKLSITLDMKHPEAIDLIKRLIKISDVVSENFSPGVMKKLGLNYDELKKIKSDIIMISFPAIGNQGPMSEVVTYGPSLASLSGLDSMIGYSGERVIGMQQAYADINAALHGAFAVQIALHHREFYGEGQYIELAQMETLISTMAEPILEYTMAGHVPGTIGNRSNTMSTHNVYRCQGDDKWISIAIRSEEEWRAFCKAIGNPPWTKMEIFADGYRRLEHQEELDKFISQWTADKNHYEVMEVLQKAGVAATPCADTEDRFLDPHFQEREVHIPFEHPATGVDWIPGMVCKLSKTSGGVRKPAPLLGQHNQYVFGKLLGLSEEAITRLEEQEILY